MQLTPLSEAECSKYFAPIRSLFKSKNNFAITLPTVLLNFKQFYNVNDLWTLQIKSLSTALLFQFNNSCLYKHISAIRLFQLQSQFMLASSPLDHWPFLYKAKSSNSNLIGTSLSLIKSTSSQLSLIVSPFLKNQIKGDATPLSKLFPLPLFESHLSTLRNHNLFYLDQLTSVTGKHLITNQDLLIRDFDHIITHMGNSRLVSDIGDLVFDNPRDRSLKLEYARSSPLPSYRSLARPPPTVDTNHKVIASWNPLINAPSFGKIIDATSDPALLQCVHHTCATTNDYCYVFTKCSGCNLFNTPPSHRGCIFSIPRNRAFYVPIYRKSSYTYANQLKNTLMEITRITFEAFYGPAAVPAIVTPSNIITSIFENSPHLSNFLEIQSAFSQSHSFTFYTDGSLKNAKSKDCSMGLGWLCIDENNLQHQFYASLINWPSSTRAELFALLSALVVTSKDSNILVYTDSQALIHGYSHYIVRNTPSTRRFEKIPNYSI